MEIMSYLQSGTDLRHCFHTVTMDNSSVKQIRKFSLPPLRNNAKRTSELYDAHKRSISNIENKKKLSVKD